LDVRRGDEPEVSFARLAKAIGQILDEAVNLAVGIAAGMKHRLQRGIPDFGFRGGQSQVKGFCAEFCPAMQDAEEPWEFGQQGLAVTLNGRLGKIALLLDLAD
jgi:hypothetical protein